jgi:hypothetical protein
MTLHLWPVKMHQLLLPCPSLLLPLSRKLLQGLEGPGSPQDVKAGHMEQQKLLLLLQQVADLTWWHPQTLVV